MPEDQKVVPQAQVTTSKKISWLKIGLTVLIILVVTGLITGAYWFFVLNKGSDTSDLTGPVPKPKVNTSTPSADIADWKVYTNTKYNYQVKYPQDWVIEVDFIVNPPSTETADEIWFWKITEKPFGQTSQIVNRMFIIISAGPNPKKLSLEDYLIEQSKLHFPPPDPDEVIKNIKNMEKTSFQGFKALKADYGDKGAVLYISKEPNIFALTLGFEEFSEKFKIPPKETFDQVVSTLKFQN